MSYNDGYSAAHQIVSSVVNNASYVPVPGTYTNAYAAANGLNQYTAVNGGAAGGHDCQGHAEQFSYDCNGNLTSDGVFAFGYDPENRLMIATASGVSASYAYDPLDRRTKKTVNGVATYFLDSGADEVGEYAAAGTLLRRYIPSTAVDHPLAMIDYTQSGNPKAFFHQDKTGSVVAMSDTSGNVAAGPWTYDPYGMPSSAAGEPYKFDGMRFDTETGCYYDRARYYCPAIGRFLQTDPVGYADDVDWYNYVGNDPTDRTDPSGKYTCTPNGDGTQRCTATGILDSIAMNVMLAINNAYVTIVSHISPQQNSGSTTRRRTEARARAIPRTRDNSRVPVYRVISPAELSHWKKRVTMAPAPAKRGSTSP